jgi:NAD(P)H dehydrogenase (quinone)
MQREILILFYSRHGSVAALAAQIARGVNSVDGAAARLRTVPPVAAQTEERIPPVPASGAPYVTKQDLADCAGLVLGSPTRFGSMATPLKHFLDSTAGEWLAGVLSGKPAAVFTSTSSPHGGQESTLLSMAVPLLHHGMILVGVPYTETALVTTSGGGSPYGAGHLAREQSAIQLTDEESRIARHLGRRVAQIALRLAG